MKFLYTTPCANSNQSVSPVSLRVFSLELPDISLTNFELPAYARVLRIPHFSGVFMIDTLPKQPHSVECGIVNLNTSSHWQSLGMLLSEQER